MFWFDGAKVHGFDGTPYEQMRTEFGLIVVIGAKGAGADADGLGKQTGEVGIVVEAEQTGNLLYAERGVSQFALHAQHDFAVDVLARR